MCETWSAAELAPDSRREAGEQFDPSLTKAQASKKIDKLQAKTGRDKENAL
jgi:Protein of unknown function (DUF3072)